AGLSEAAGDRRGRQRPQRYPGGSSGLQLRGATVASTGPREPACWPLRRVEGTARRSPVREPTSPPALRRRAERAWRRALGPAESCRRSRGETAPETLRPPPARASAPPTNGSPTTP